MQYFGPFRIIYSKLVKDYSVFTILCSLCHNTNAAGHLDSPHSCVFHNTFFN